MFSQSSCLYSNTVNRYVGYMRGYHWLQHSKKCWVKYNRAQGKIWTNPGIGLFRPRGWVKHFPQLLVKNNPACVLFNIYPAQHFLERKLSVCVSVWCVCVWCVCGVCLCACLRACMHVVCACDAEGTYSLLI